MAVTAVALASNGRAANAEPVSPAQVAAAVAAATGTNEDSADPVETSSPPTPATPLADTAAPTDTPLTTSSRPLYVPEEPTTEVPPTAVQQQPTAAVDGGTDDGAHYQKVSADHAPPPVRPSRGETIRGGGGNGRQKRS